MPRFDFPLLCPNCLTIYLDLAGTLSEFTLISCSSCSTYVARWGELEASIAQGGQHRAYCTMARSFGKSDLILFHVNGFTSLIQDFGRPVFSNVWMRLPAPGNDTIMS
jgi:hypothetical protein